MAFALLVAACTAQEAVVPEAGSAGSEDTLLDRPSRWCDQIEIRCGDAAMPDGRVIGYAVLKSTNSTSQDYVLWDPGGPGIDGAEFVGSLGSKAIPGWLRSRFNVVGFRSSIMNRASLAGAECGVRQQSFWLAWHSGDQAATKATAKNLAASCLNGLVTEFDRTYEAEWEAVAADLDITNVGVVVQSFGSQRILSYTTSPATSVDWVILVSPFAPPGRSGLEILDDRIEATTALLDRSWDRICAEASESRRCSTSWVAAVRSAQDRLDRQPIEIDTRSLPLTSADLGAALLRMTYSPLDLEESVWTSIDKIIRNGSSDVDYSTLTSLSDAVMRRFGANEFSSDNVAFWAEACGALTWEGPADFQLALDRFQDDTVGSGLIGIYLPCAYVTQTPSPAIVTSSAARVAVVSNLRDGVTPAWWSESWARLLNPDVVLEVEQPGHGGSYLNETCVAEILVPFVDGVTSSANVTKCAPAD